MAATSGMGTVNGENVALDALLGSGSPATVYLCIYSAAPTKAGGGTEITNMPRLAVTNNATNWPAASGAAKSNGAAMTMGPATGTCATPVAWGIHVHSTNDALRWWGPISAKAGSSLTSIGTGDSVTFDVGDIDVAMKNDGE